MSFNLFFFFIFSQRILLDKIVATVDTDIITLRELKAFYPLHICSKSERNPSALMGCLNELIEFSVVQKEITERKEIKEEDYVEEEERIISELGGLNRVLGILEALDMSWEEFRGILSKKIISKKLIESLFYSRVSVSLEEIEEFYNKNYLPTMKSLEIPPLSLIEMSPAIEREIAREKTKKAIEEWIRERRSFHEINILLNENDIKNILNSFY